MDFASCFHWFYFNKLYKACELINFLKKKKDDSPVLAERFCSKAGSFKV